MSSVPTSEDTDVLDVLREVVERLAPLDRTPCSEGEREAADWLAARLRGIPGVRVSVDEEPSWGTFPPTATALGAIGTLGSLLVLARRRALGALLCALSIAGVVDEAQNGPRIARRLLRRRKRTVNVIAAVGDEEAAGTLVVLAHHDAPQTGAIFDQTMQQRVYERAPRVIESTKTPLPQWWLGLAPSVAGVLAGVSGRRGLARFAAVGGALATASVADIWRSPTVPGANDNLSGVAALVALAERLTAAPVPGLRTLLVSCGAEETLQDGIRAFMARHRGELDPERTWFVNLDTVGSPLLVQLEAEGPVWMEYYRGPWLRDLVHECAERRSIPIERGYRARASTDSVIPSRAGYAIATLVSITPWRAPANYHLPSDTPENLDYATVAGAVELVEEVAAALAQRADGERVAGA